MRWASFPRCSSKLQGIMKDEMGIIHYLDLPARELKGEKERKVDGRYSIQIREHEFSLNKVPSS